MSKPWSYPEYRCQECDGPIEDNEDLELCQKCFDKDGFFSVGDPRAWKDGKPPIKDEVPSWFYHLCFGLVILSAILFLIVIVHEIWRMNQ